jgi:hypothetical protein
LTHDALAWTQLAAGDILAAEAEMNLALAEGTRDARLFFHAAAIASQAGHQAKAMNWQKEALTRAQMLLPSERKQLQQLSAGSGQANQSSSAQATQPISAF